LPDDRRHLPVVSGGINAKRASQTMTGPYSPTELRSVEEIPREELGVEHDTAVDRMVAAGSAAKRLRRMAAELDSIFDSEVPGDVAGAAQMLRREMHDAAADASTAADRQSDRVEAIKERLEDEVYDNGD
jgi:hypothetical protein